MADRFKDAYRGRKWAGTPAEAMTRRVNGKAVWTGQLTLAPDHILTEPLRRRKPTTYFVNSMGDLFHEDTPEEWIDRVFAVMALAPQHTFQVLTKRAERMRRYVGNLPNRDDIVADAADQLLGGETKVEKLISIQRRVRMPLPNVWLGVSAEDQRRADERIPELLATPAAVRFVSAEPLLGPIDFRNYRVCSECENTPFKLFKNDPLCPQPMPIWSDQQCPLHWWPSDGCDGTLRSGIDWIIVGGESGPGARPMHPDWARQIRDQCAAAGTAFFFKQWGEWRLTPAEDGSEEWPARWFGDKPPAKGQIARMERVGKKAAGRLLDGAVHNAMPEERR